MDVESAWRPLVLVFDDLPDFTNALCDGLRLHGCEAEGFTHPDDAIRFVRFRLPDAAILDIRVDIPTCASTNDGIALYQKIRAYEQKLRDQDRLPSDKRNVLIYFLTSAPKADQRIEVLPNDVQDYLKKPDLAPTPAHALAERIWADLRPARVEIESQPAPERELVESVREGSIACGSLQLMTGQGRCEWNGVPVELSASQFAIVFDLAQHAGAVRSREELQSVLSEGVSKSRDIDFTSHIKRIRIEFLKIDSTFDRIKTRYGFGYEWVAD